MADTINELLIELQDLIGKIEIILFGSETEQVSHNGLSRDSVAKEIKNKYLAIQALVQGSIAYETKLAMDAAGAPPSGELAKVWNDSTKLNNGLYGYTGGAWVKSSYDPESYSESLSEELFSKLVDLSGESKSGINIFDVSRALQGQYVNTAGSLSANAGYTASDYIPVLKGASYRFNTGVSHLSYYDYSKNHLNHIGSVAADTEFVVPADAIFLRFSQTNVGVLGQMLVKGQLPGEYVSFGSVDVSTMQRTIVGQVREELQSALPVVRNLFDGSRAVDGYALNSAGSIYVAADYFVTDFLSVVGGEGFVISSNTGSFCFYNENKEFISHVAGASAGDLITPPSGAYFTRIQINPLSAKPSLMVVYGTEIPSSYVPFLGAESANPAEGLEVSRAVVNAALPVDRNLFDKALAIDDMAISDVNGSLYPVSGYFVTGYIEVSPGGHFATNNGSNAICFYTYDKKFISGGSLSGGVGVSVPDDAYYIRFHIYGLAKKESLYVVSGSSAPVGYKSHGIGVDLPWSGKKIAWLGDSITNSALYLPKVIALTGLETVSNFGVPGRPVRAMTKDASDVLLDAADLADVDVVHILGGTNDYGGNRALGSMADAYDGSSVQTFYNDVYQLISHIFGIAPAVNIVFSTPTIRGAFDSQPVYPAANGAGAMLPDYVRAIKEVCLLFGVPICDLFSLSGINLINIDSFTSDKLHPNQQGADRMARVIAGVINGV